MVQWPWQGLTLPRVGKVPSRLARSSARGEIRKEEEKKRKKNYLRKLLKY